MTPTPPGSIRRQPPPAMSADTPPRSAPVTALLQAWGDGDEAALQALLPLVER